jgi:DNA-binding CsgD family transcriptional regulator
MTNSEDLVAVDSVDHLNLLAEIATLQTQFDIFRFLKRVTEHFGMRCFIVMKVPGATAQDIQATSVITNWPANVLARYDAEGLLTASPVVQKLRESTLPFSYDTEKVNENRSGDKKSIALDLFISNGMARGAYFPVCDPAGERSAIGFSGSRALLSQYETMQLLIICVHVCDRLYQIGRKDVRGGEELTEREIDCLNWTAAGKTSAEISEILGLSEHTVNHYLNRATKKLDTVNRTQAVAKALRMGIIN